MVVLWRKCRGSPSMQCAHADIFTVWAPRIANSKCSSITTLRRSFLAIAVVFLISSGGMSRNNSRLSPRWVPPLIPVQPVPGSTVVLVCARSYRDDDFTMTCFWTASGISDNCEPPIIHTQFLRNLAWVIGHRNWIASTKTKFRSSKFSTVQFPTGQVHSNTI